MDFPDENTIIEIVKQRLNGKLEFDEELLREIILINNRNVRSILIELNRILDELEHPISEKITKDIVKIRGVESYKDSQNVTVDENIRISPQQAIILEKLLGNELTIKQLSELTNLPYNTVSKQISRLVEKGLLLKKEKDKKIYYSINPAYLPIIMKKLGK
ncbi:MAG TPA: transcriptional regulator [Candidatus Nanopusillus sp.]|nr:transcriptional regulator [Candidatus Nanopusillus sp.]